MASLEETYHIAMIRLDLADIPQHSLPKGYSIRTYRPGDEEHWVRIHEKADTHQEVTLETFRQSFGDDLSAMQDRGFFLETAESEVVGTATAWYEMGFHGKDYGLVHWVAIVPEHQGRGLSKALLSRVMNRLAQSHEGGLLRTSADRIPAIHLYLNYGFRPLYYEQACAGEWERVKKELSHPLLDNRPIFVKDL